MPKSRGYQEGESKNCAGCYVVTNALDTASVSCKLRKILTFQSSRLSRGCGLIVYGMMTWPRHAVPLMRV